MRCRLLTAATMAVLLLLGPLAATAFAQQGVTDEALDRCIDALLRLDDSPLGPITEDVPRPTLEELLARDLDPAQICSTYGADVLAVDEELEPVDDDEGEVAAAVAQPAEVLGVSLARTGANALVLGLFGALLVGLGVLAVRHPKRVNDGD